MPKRIATGVVTSDKAAKTRRVEIPRQVRHPKYGKILHRKTVCHVHDEKGESHVGDTVEIVECPPKSATKRWELVRVLEITDDFGIQRWEVETDRGPRVFEVRSREDLRWLHPGHLIVRDVDGNRYEIKRFDDLDRPAAAVRKLHRGLQ